jgi:uncharacterized protein YbjT (DUF2867 family)
MTILVTGGTGTLGRPTVERLRAAGHDVRILSRTAGPDRATGDVTTGAGLPEALRGVETVLHLATSSGKKDVRQTRNVVDAARAAGVSHLLYISIVGVDVNPFPYYRAKFESERVIEGSGIPYTILRATQFHNLIVRYVDDLHRWLPFIMSFDVLDQPIAVEEVADRVVELTEAGPSGMAADIGGPEQLPLRTLIDLWRAASGTSKRVVTVKPWGRSIRAFKAGVHMTPLPGFGRETFAEFAARAAKAGGDA